MDEFSQETTPRFSTSPCYVKDIKAGDVVLMKGVPVKATHVSSKTASGKNKSVTFIIDGESVFERKKREMIITGPLTFVDSPDTIFKRYEVVAINGDALTLRDDETGTESSDLCLVNEDGPSWEVELSRQIKNVASSGQSLSVTVAEWYSDLKIVEVNPR